MTTKNILTGSKRTMVKGHVAAGTSTQTSAILDMNGFDSVVFDTLIGTNTTGQALGILQVQGGNVAGGSDMANLVGASLTLADTSTAVGVSIEVFRPIYRYLQLVFTRTGQAPELLGMIATQYHDRQVPESDDVTTWPQSVIAIEPQYSQSYYTTTTTTPLKSTTQMVTTARTAS